MDDIHDGGGVFHSGYVGSMGHNIFSGDVVKLKDIVDHISFVFFDRTFLVADVNHHTDFLFGDLLCLAGWVDVQQL